MRSTFSRFLMMVCVVGMLTLISATAASAQIICDNPSDPFDCYDPDDYPIDDHIYYLIGVIGFVAFVRIKWINKTFVNANGPA
ncbi:MAG: hypothetical protein EOO86_16020 [Pedobacter sp.]|nr:MAG: hypothetical protein EOO86_16020 [Pedobacter sp.]